MIQKHFQYPFGYSKIMFLETIEDNYLNFLSLMYGVKIKKDFNKMLYIDEVYVNEIYRNKGYGKAIMNDIIKFAEENRIDKLLLVVVNDFKANPEKNSLLKWYEKQLFKVDEVSEYITVMTRKLHFT